MDKKKIDFCEKPKTVTTKMANFDLISTRVSQLVPVFTGEGNSVRRNLLQFLDCCKSVKGSTETKADANNILIKLRFRGEAYDPINISLASDFNSIDKL